MALSTDTLRQIVAISLATADTEMSCGECDLEVDRFAEMTLAGLDAAEALPIVEEHLERCPCCHLEFEALMDALRAAERADRPWWSRWRTRRR